MKSLIVLLIFAGNLGAADPVRVCTQATQNLSNIINNYVEIMKECRDNPTGSYYREYQAIARDLEVLHQRARANCYDACLRVDDFSARLCLRPERLQSACP